MASRKRHATAGQGREATDQAQPPVGAYGVDLTKGAEAAYRKLYQAATDAEKRGDANSAHGTTLRMVDDALDALAHDPTSKKYALSGSLSNIFRIKKGRMRICWLASSQKRKVTVLYISETPRKEGDARDPYKVFTNLVMSGQFDDVFDRLGVKRPR